MEVKTEPVDKSNPQRVVIVGLKIPFMEVLEVAIQFWIAGAFIGVAIGTAWLIWSSR